jgi:hypothetical protein
LRRTVAHTNANPYSDTNTYGHADSNPDTIGYAYADAAWMHGDARVLGKSRQR